MSAEQQPNGAENQFNVHPGDVIFQAPAVVVDPDGYLDTADVDPAHLEAFVDAFGTSPGVLARRPTARAPAPRRPTAPPSWPSAWAS